MKRSLLLTVLAPVLAAGSLNAQIFLELDGIKGESSDHLHRDTIEIQSFSWGANSSIGSATTGAGGGKAEFSELQVTTRLSKATPQLLVACASTNPIPRATIFMRKSGAESVDYYTITLENVLVSSLKQCGAGATSTASGTNPPPPSESSSQPTEKVAFAYSKVTLSYTGTNGTVTTGTAGSAPVR